MTSLDRRVPERFVLLDGWLTSGISADTRPRAGRSVRTGILPDRHDRSAQRHGCIWREAAIPRGPKRGHACPLRTCAATASTQAPNTGANAHAGLDLAHGRAPLVASEGCGC